MVEVGLGNGVSYLAVTRRHRYNIRLSWRVWWLVEVIDVNVLKMQSLPPLLTLQMLAPRLTSQARFRQLCTTSTSTRLRDLWVLPILLACLLMRDMVYFPVAVSVMSGGRLELGSGSN